MEQAYKRSEKPIKLKTILSVALPQSPQHTKLTNIWSLTVVKFEILYPLQIKIDTIFFFGTLKQKKLGNTSYCSHCLPVTCMFRMPTRRKIRCDFYHRKWFCNDKSKETATPTTSTIKQIVHNSRDDRMNGMRLALQACSLKAPESTLSYATCDSVRPKCVFQRRQFLIVVIEFNESIWRVNWLSCCTNNAIERISIEFLLPIHEILTLTGLPLGSTWLLNQQSVSYFNCCLLLQQH